MPEKRLAKTRALYKYQCPTCGEEFDTQAELKKHNEDIKEDITTIKISQLRDSILGNDYNQ